MRSGYLTRVLSALGKCLIVVSPSIYKSINRLNRAALRHAFKDTSQNSLLDFWRSFDFVSLKQENYKHFGADEDGGYFLAFPFGISTEVVSVGLGDNITFDFEISPYVNRIHMWDHTIAPPGEIPVNSIYYPKGLGPKTFGDFISLEEMFDNLDQESRIILKIDIEGAEWEILNSLSRSVLDRVDQIVIEFHGLFEVVRNQVKFESALRTLRLVSSDFYTINVNPNNWGNAQVLHGITFPDVIEVSYLRKDLNFDGDYGRISWKGFPNNPNQPRLLLQSFEDILR